MDSSAKCPAEFHLDEFTLGQKIQIASCSEIVLPPSIPNDEKIIAGLNRPPQSCVRPHILRLIVILYEGAQDKFRAEGEHELRLPESLHDGTLSHSTKIVGTD